MDRLPLILIQIGVLIFAVIVHEVAHGWVAYKLGDKTAHYAGRLTLNPLPHIDPFMSILLPVILIFTGAPFIIGGAKPVPVNPALLNRPKRDLMLVSAAGPGSNILLAILSIVFLKVATMVYFLQTPGFIIFLRYSIIINVVLAVFNLIPIPPLDGSKIAMGFMSPNVAEKYASIAPYGMFIIILLLMAGVLQLILMPVFYMLQKLLAIII